MSGSNQTRKPGAAATQQSQPQPGKKPQAEDFTGAAVSKAVLKESLEHPATIYPAAGSALAVAWTLMVAASPTSLAFALGCAFVGASSFIYNYVVKGPDKATAYVAKLRELRRQHALIELEAFALECSKNGLVEGAKSARELKTAYLHLTDYLQSHKDGIGAERFASLAEDTFQEGMRILGQALAVYKAVEITDVAVLAKEVERWKKQLEGMDPKNPSVRALTMQIEANQRRITIDEQQQNELVQLFAQANEIESALQTTYLELIDLQNHNIGNTFNEEGGAASRLKSAVDVARRVEQRLRGDDSEDQEKRDKYVKVYQNSMNNQTQQTHDPSQDQSQEEQQ